MDPTEPVKTARPTRARKGRTIDTLLGHLPQGDRRPTAPPALDCGLPVFSSGSVVTRSITARLG